MKIRRTLLALAALGTALLVYPAIAGLPLTPSTTYVAGSTPTIKAQDLNDIQKYLAGLYSGLYSIKSLDVDGTGGATAGANSGMIRVGGLISGSSTTFPFALSSATPGQLAKEQIPLGAIRCDIAAGALTGCGGTNLRAAVRVSAGTYQVTLNTAFPNLGRQTAIVTPLTDGVTYTIGMVSSPSIVASGYRVTLLFSNLAGALTDPVGFSYFVMGG